MEDVRVWQVRYINVGETKMRRIVLETPIDAGMTELLEELEQNNLTPSQIISIRNVTLKSDRNAMKRKSED